MTISYIILELFQDEHDISIVVYRKPDEYVLRDYFQTEQAAHDALAAWAKNQKFYMRTFTIQKVVTLSMI